MITNSPDSDNKEPLTPCVPQGFDVRERSHMHIRMHMCVCMYV